MRNLPRSLRATNRLSRFPLLSGGSGGKTRSTTSRTREKPPGRHPGATIHTAITRTRLVADPRPSGRHAHPPSPFTPWCRASVYQTRLTRVAACLRHTHPLHTDSLLSRGHSPPSPLRLSLRLTAHLSFPLPRLQLPSLPSPFNMRRLRVHIHYAEKAHSSMYRGSHEPRS